MKAIRPLAENGDTVLLRRADYEALVREAEDAADAAQIREAEARVEAGHNEYGLIDVTKRLRAKCRRAWREHRGLSARGLAARAGDLGRLSEPDRDRQETRLVRRHGQARPRARRRHGGSREPWRTWSVGLRLCSLSPKPWQRRSRSWLLMSRTYRIDALAASTRRRPTCTTRASWTSGRCVHSTSCASRRCGR
jgi:hypothetical protein